MMSPRTVSSRRTRSDLVALLLVVPMKRSELLGSMWTGIAPDLRCSFVEPGSGSLLTVILSLERAVVPVRARGRKQR